MTQNTRISNRFEYHTEDLDCAYCLYFKRKSKHSKYGCGEDACRFEGIQRQAAKNGKTKRLRGWNK